MIHVFQNNGSARRLLLVFLLFGLTPVLAEDQPEAALRKDALSKFRSIASFKDSKDATPDLIELGRQLFFDPRFSSDGVHSCVLCHQPSLYGMDGRATSLGVENKALARNAPTILNSSLHVSIHWDGIFETVEQQASRAPLGPAFGNSSQDVAIARIKAIPGYADAFQRAFPEKTDRLTLESVGVAIGAYERTLITPGRWDDFLDGRPRALADNELNGLRLFLKTGCADCHHGSGIGGHSYEKFGVVSEYAAATHSQKIDQGRFEITKKEADQFVFKVSSLRNVEMTAPYFHDGSVKTLPAAVRVMATVQLGSELTEPEVEQIVAFLRSLTGPLPKAFAEAPLLPPGAYLANP